MARPLLRILGTVIAALSLISLETWFLWREPWSYWALLGLAGLVLLLGLGFRFWFGRAVAPRKSKAPRPGAVVAAKVAAAASKRAMPRGAAKSGTRGIGGRGSSGMVAGAAGKQQTPATLVVTTTAGVLTTTDLGRVVAASPSAVASSDSNAGFALLQWLLRLGGRSVTPPPDSTSEGASGTARTAGGIATGTGSRQAGPLRSAPGALAKVELFREIRRRGMAGRRRAGPPSPDLELDDDDDDDVDEDDDTVDGDTLGLNGEETETLLGDRLEALSTASGPRIGLAASSVSGSPGLSGAMSPLTAGDQLVRPTRIDGSPVSSAASISSVGSPALLPVGMRPPSLVVPPAAAAFAADLKSQEETVMDGVDPALLTDSDIEDLLFEESEEDAEQRAAALLLPQAERRRRRRARRQRQQRRLKLLLQRCFHGLPETVLDELFAKLVWTELEPGEVLWDFGWDSADGLTIVVDGDLTVYGREHRAEDPGWGVDFSSSASGGETNQGMRHPSATQHAQQPRHAQYPPHHQNQGHQQQAQHAHSLPTQPSILSSTQGADPVSSSGEHGHQAHLQTIFEAHSQPQSESSQPQTPFQAQPHSQPQPQFPMTPELAGSRSVPQDGDHHQALRAAGSRSVSPSLPLSHLVDAHHQGIQDTRFPAPTHPAQASSPSNFSESSPFTTGGLGGLGVGTAEKMGPAPLRDAMARTARSIGDGRVSDGADEDPDMFAFDVDGFGPPSSDGGVQGVGGATLNGDSFMLAQDGHPGASKNVHADVVGHDPRAAGFQHPHKASHQDQHDPHSYNQPQHSDLPQRPHQLPHARSHPHPQPQPLPHAQSRTHAHSHDSNQPALNQRPPLRSELPASLPPPAPVELFVLGPGEVLGEPELVLGGRRFLRAVAGAPARPQANLQQYQQSQSYNPYQPQTNSWQSQPGVVGAAGGFPVGGTGCAVLQLPRAAWLEACARHPELPALFARGSLAKLWRLGSAVIRDFLRMPLPPLLDPELGRSVEFPRVTASAAAVVAKQKSAVKASSGHSQDASENGGVQRDSNSSLMKDTVAPLERATTTATDAIIQPDEPGQGLQVQFDNLHAHSNQGQQLPAAASNTAMGFMQMQQATRQTSTQSSPATSKQRPPDPIPGAGSRASASLSHQSAALEAELAALVRNSPPGRLLRLGPGERLNHRPAGIGESLYLVVSGTLKARSNLGGGPQLLGPGSLLSAVAFVTQDPRSRAEAICCSAEARVLRFLPSDLDRNASAPTQRNIAGTQGHGDATMIASGYTRAPFLIPLCASVGRALARTVARFRLLGFRQEHRRAGSILWQKGDPADRLYIVASGKVRLYAEPAVRADLLGLEEESWGAPLDQPVSGNDASAQAASQNPGQHSQASHSNLQQQAQQRQQRWLSQENIRLEVGRGQCVGEGAFLRGPPALFEGWTSFPPGGGGGGASMGFGGAAGGNVWSSSASASGWSSAAPGAHTGATGNVFGGRGGSSHSSSRDAPAVSLSMDGNTTTPAAATAPTHTPADPFANDYGPSPNTATAGTGLGVEPSRDYYSDSGSDYSPYRGPLAHPYPHQQPHPQQHHQYPQQHQHSRHHHQATELGPARPHAFSAVTVRDSELVSIGRPAFWLLLARRFPGVLGRFAQVLAERMGELMEGAAGGSGSGGMSGVYSGMPQDGPSSFGAGGGGGSGVGSSATGARGAAAGTWRQFGNPCVACTTVAVFPADPGVDVDAFCVRLQRALQGQVSGISDSNPGSATESGVGGSGRGVLGSGLGRGGANGPSGDLNARVGSGAGVSGGALRLSSGLLERRLGIHSAAIATATAATTLGSPHQQPRQTSLPAWIGRSSSWSAAQRAQVANWLSEQEGSHRFVIFQLSAEPQDLFWSRLSIRSADCVLVLASGDAGVAGSGATPPGVSRMEYELLWAGDSGVRIAGGGAAAGVLTPTAAASAAWDGPPRKGVDDGGRSPMSRRLDRFRRLASLFRSPRPNKNRSSRKTLRRRKLAFSSTQSHSSLVGSGSLSADDASCDENDNDTEDDFNYGGSETDDTETDVEPDSRRVRGASADDKHGTGAGMGRRRFLFPFQGLRRWRRKWRQPSFAEEAKTQEFQKQLKLQPPSGQLTQPQSQEADPQVSSASLDTQVWGQQTQQLQNVDSLRDRRRARRLLAATISFASKELVLVQPPGTEIPRGTREHLDCRPGLDHHHQLRWDLDSHFARIARYLSGQTVCAVLGGGGARGLSHLGTMRALVELGLPVDATGGCSQGAFMAAALALEPELNAQGLARIEQRTRSMAVRLGSIGELLKDATLPVMSYFSGERFSRAIAELLGPGVQIEDAWIPFFCVTTNISRADITVHRRDSLWRAVRASMSILDYLPPMWVPNPGGDGSCGSLLADGGYLDNLPVDVCRRIWSPGHVIAVDVENKNEQHLQNVSRFGDSLSGWEIMGRRLKARLGLGPRFQLPGFHEILGSLVYLHHNRNLRAFLRGNLIDVYIRPALGAIALLDYDKLEAIVELGYQASMKLLREYGRNRIPGARC